MLKLRFLFALLMVHSHKVPMMSAGFI